jgi:hypothetical protein
LDAGGHSPAGDDDVRFQSQLWMFPYVEACRIAGVLELHSGDVLGLSWDRGLKRPTLAPPGSGRRCIVVRVQRAWHGYASKIVVSVMGEHWPPA